MCPKWNKEGWNIITPIISPPIKLPATQYLWCGEGSVCTFPFYFKNKLYYEPVVVHQMEDFKVKNVFVVVTGTKRTIRCGTYDGTYFRSYTNFTEMKLASSCSGITSSISVSDI